MWRDKITMSGQYDIKCDECKKVIGTTDSMGESAMGGYCNECRAKHIRSSRVKLGYVSKSELDARKDSYKKQDMSIRGVK